MTAPTAPSAVAEGALTPVWELVPYGTRVRVDGEWLLLVAVFRTQRSSQVRLEFEGGRVFIAETAAERRARRVPVDQSGLVVIGPSP